jgi:hypothetical protein
MNIGKPVSRYVGVDIADNSLRNLLDDRLANLPENQQNTVTHLIVADLGRDVLTQSRLKTFDRAAAARSGRSGALRWESRVPLSEEDQFDIISCQFAMHYMFQVCPGCLVWQVKGPRC